MNCSLLSMRRQKTNRTFGGVTYSRTQPPSNSTIDAWYVVFMKGTERYANLGLQAITTYACTALMFAVARRPILKAALPPLTRRMVTSAFAMANIQVLLGISTLLYLVPVPLAALHQAGSVALLTTLVHLVVSLRRPGVAARAWRQATRASKAQASRL